MDLAIQPPLAPMEAEQVATLPVDGQWQYEPKWDGFRCIAFRDDKEVYLQSKSGKPLGRYFPDIVESLASLKTRRFVLDGELVIPLERRLSFEQLQLRLHPAASRVQRLVKEHRAAFILFDCLMTPRGRVLLEQPLDKRRAELEKFAEKALKEAGAIHLSPATLDVAVAESWMHQAGVELDGAIAKRRDVPYDSGGRSAMLKVKNLRSVDCVVGGFRYASSGKVVGSLLLGLYDETGKLDHVGYTSAFRQQDQKALTAKLEQLSKRRGRKGFTGRAPDGPSRWSKGRSAVYTPLPHELVCEVQYDHVTDQRFRHGTSLLR